jgi:hypothetical protein
MPLRTRLFLIILAGCLVLTAAGSAIPREALDPTRVPGMPTEPPPLLTRSPQAPDPEVSNWPTQQVQTSAGWQLINFPVGRLEALRGLDRMLLRRGPGGLEAIDPVNRPQQVDPGQAYLAYCDRPGLVEFSGPPAENLLHTSRLYAGWNFLASPFQVPVQRQNITLTRPGGTTARPAEVAGPETSPGRAWIFSTLYGYRNSRWVAADLRSPGEVFGPSRMGAIFCWSEMDLNWNQSPPSGGSPTLQKTTPPRATPGQVVTLTGCGLGSPGRGILSLSGLPIQPENILEWTPTRVKFRVPPGAFSGALRVMVDRYPGNSLNLEVGSPPARPAPSAPTTGSLVGQVVSSDGRLLANAQIHLDDGHEALSDLNGTFRIDNLPAGPVKAYITLPGFKSASGQVQITAGATRTLQVSLSPTSGPEVGARSVEKSGSFTVMAYPFTLGQEQKNRYWVYRIEAWEYGNYKRRWDKTWWTDIGDPKFELNCPVAPLGRSYAVVVTWRNQAGDERTCRWTPKVHRDGEIFRYYNPLGSQGLAPGPDLAAIARGSAPPRPHAR